MVAGCSVEHKCETLGSPMEVWFWRALDSVCCTEWNTTNIQLDEFNVLLSLKKVRKELPANWSIENAWHTPTRAGMRFHRRIKWVKRAGSGMNSTHTQHIRLKTPRLCVYHFTTYFTCSICGCKCPYTAFIHFGVIFLLQSSELASAFSSFYIFSLISLPFTSEHSSKCLDVQVLSPPHILSAPHPHVTFNPVRTSSQPSNGPWKLWAAARTFHVRSQEPMSTRVSQTLNPSLPSAHLAPQPHIHIKLWWSGERSCDWEKKWLRRSQYQKACLLIPKGKFKHVLQFQSFNKGVTGGFKWRRCYIHWLRAWC